MGNQVSERPSILGIIVSPMEQFKRIRINPVFGLALTIASILFALLTVYNAYLGFNDPQTMQKIMGAQPPGQTVSLDLIKQIGLISSAVMGILTVLLLSLLSALFSWIMVNLFQGEATFKQLFSMHVYLSALMVLALLVQTFVSLATGKIFLASPTSLAGIIKAEGVTGAILSSFEVFNIWTVVLYALGLQTLARLSVPRAWICAGIYFIAVTLVTVALSLLNPSM